MSRKKILAAIKRNKPEYTPLPELSTFSQNATDLAAAFELAGTTNKCRVVTASARSEVASLASTLYQNAKVVVTIAEGVDYGNLDIEQIESPKELERVDLAVIDGLLGVAENSAVWVTEQELRHRILPFITQHLIIVLPKSKLVWNMNEAYAKIAIDDTGFGVFIAGPSKTADIEQSLVIGAQGPRSSTVILVEDE